MLKGEVHSQFKIFATIGTQVKLVEYSVSGRYRAEVAKGNFRRADYRH
jgi:hypothetical protein